MLCLLLKAPTKWGGSHQSHTPQHSHAPTTPTFPTLLRDRSLARFLSHAFPFPTSPTYSLQFFNPSPSQSSGYPYGFSSFVLLFSLTYPGPLFSDCRVALLVRGFDSLLFCVQLQVCVRGRACVFRFFSRWGWVSVGGARCGFIELETSILWAS